MKTYKVTLIDDEEKALDFLKSIIEGIPGFEVNCAATSPFEGLNFAIGAKSDLVITDILMPEVNGFWIAQRLKANNIPVIITSAQWSQGWMAFDVDAIDFLGKPLEFVRVNSSLEKFKQFSKKQSTDLTLHAPIMLKHHLTNSIVPIDKNRIIYAKGGKDYAEIYSIDKFSKDQVNKELCRATMAFLHEKLAHADFIQVHKSYIVNRNMISRYEYHQIHLLKEIVIPIGISYRKSLYRQFNEAAVS